MSKRKRQEAENEDEVLLEETTAQQQPLKKHKQDTSLLPFYLQRTVITKRPSCSDAISFLDGNTIVTCGGFLNNYKCKILCIINTICSCQGQICNI